MRAATVQAHRSRKHTSPCAPDTKIRPVSSASGMPITEPPLLFVRFVGSANVATRRPVRRSRTTSSLLRRNSDLLLSHD